MALIYTVTETPGRSMSFDGTGDNLKITWTREYDVLVTGTPDPTTNPASISEYDVLTANGLPIVNKTVYTVNNKILPWVICRNKTAKRDKQRRNLFRVTTKWDTGDRSDNAESDNVPQDKPSAVTGITPRVESELGEIEEVLYQDKSSLNSPIITPTGNFYAEPAVERVPTLTLRVSQYESSINFQTMLDRKLKVNEDTYRGIGRYGWLVEQVEAHEVDVELSGGPTTAALVTYTLVYSPRDNGWKDDRALIDTHYIDGSGSKIPFADDEQRTLTVGFVKADGTDNSSASAPDYAQFETYDTISFGFLQA